MTPDDFGKHAKDLVDKFQKNVFVCENCGTDVEYHSYANHFPVFPCQVCEKVKWKVFSINDKVIYR